MAEKAGTMAVTLLFNTGGDGGTVRVWVAGEVKEAGYGRFVRMVVICPDQGVAYDGHPIQADWNWLKNRWQVDHPGN